MPDVPFQTVFDGRPVWQFPDGVMVPVVSGGDDDDFGDETTGLSDAAAAFVESLDDDSPPEAPPADSAPAPATAAPEGAPDGEPRMVPWDEYVALRRENAAHRQRFQPYEQTFANLDPEVSNALLQVAKAYGEDPDEAAAMLLQAFGIDVPGADQPEGLTPESIRAAMREEVAAVLAEQRSEVAQAQALAENREQVKTVARELGVEPGTKAYSRLLRIAKDEFSTDEFGDPVPAEKAIRAAHKSVMDELAEFERATLAKVVEAKGSQGGVRVTGAGEAPSTESEILDLADSKAALKDWLQSAW